MITLSRFIGIYLRAGFDDVPHEIQAIHQIFFDCKLIVRMRFIVSATEVDATDRKTISPQGFHIRHHPCLWTVTKPLWLYVMQKLLTTNPFPRYLRDNIVISTTVGLYHKTAILEECHVCRIASYASDLFAHEKCDFYDVISRKAL